MWIILALAMVEYFAISIFIPRHPVIACIIFIVLACGTLVTWKEDISFMIQRLDADIEEDIRIQESARKKKRKKSISKLVWFLIKAWRI